eukprot:6983329-Pyramimonas_sp.AAC.1
MAQDGDSEAWQTQVRYGTGLPLSSIDLLGQVALAYAGLPILRVIQSLAAHVRGCALLEVAQVLLYLR